MSDDAGGLAGESELPDGVRALDHTADVGLEIEAPDLGALFLRAAQGLEVLIDGARPVLTPAPPEVTLQLDAPDVALLLADWLRELLYLRQVRRLALVGAEFQELSLTRLDARLRTGPAPAEAAREIKGVTYHGLEAASSDEGWRARVIFDV